MEVRTELVSRIAAHAPSVGEHSTAIAGLVLFRRTQATACYRAAVEPSLTVFVQGKKRISLGGTAYLCGPSSFFLSSIDVPIESQIVEASATGRRERSPGSKTTMRSVCTWRS